MKCKLPLNPMAKILHLQINGTNSNKQTNRVSAFLYLAPIQINYLYSPLVLLNELGLFQLKCNVKWVFIEKLFNFYKFGLVSTVFSLELSYPVNYSYTTFF